MIRILSLLLFYLLASPAIASNLFLSGVGSTAGTGCNESTAFIARTTGLDVAHQVNYQNLICGLVTDGVWSKLDAFYITATQNQAAAILDLKSSSFTLTANGSPTFTADRGFTGVNDTATVYLDTGFNASTAGGSYAQNAASLSGWCNANVTPSGNGGAIVGARNTSSNLSQLWPAFSDGFSYYLIQESNNAADNVSNPGGTAGFYVANRSGASATQGYKNAVAQTLGSSGTSSVLVNNNFYVLASSQTAAAAVSGSACQVSEASIGGNLSATNVSNFYSRLRTYMTAVGVP